MKQSTVKSIRNEKKKITDNPILYYWWFKTDSLKILLNKLIGIYSIDRIKVKDIAKVNYSLLYIGRAKNGHNRLIKYHIFDSNNFHSKGVENGRLSSLRATLCGLLDLPMSESKENINDFMDNNCIVEWQEYSIDELNKNEKKSIRSNYLPLNYQNTKGIISKEHRKILRDSKKLMRY